MQRPQHVNKATPGSASYSEARSRRPPCQVQASGESGRRIANKTSQHGLCRGGEGFIEERIIKLKEEIRRNRARSLWCISEAKSRRRWAHRYQAGEGWAPQHADANAGEGKPISGLTCSKRSSTSNREKPSQQKGDMNTQDPNAQNTSELNQSNSESENRVHCKER